jgi:hypothetical protein
MWMRVFGLNGNVPSVAALCERLATIDVAVVPSVRGDDLGWTEAELRYGEHAIGLARFLTVEDDLRDDLNAYAAELEGMVAIEPRATPLMERVIQSKQLITIRMPVALADESFGERVGRPTAMWLAGRIDGIVQIDGSGWHAADGERLVAEY